MSINVIVYWINVFFFVYMFAYSIVFFLTTLMSSFTIDDFLMRRDFTGSTQLTSDINYIPISILVPAYNEELTIIESIESLLKLDYPKYEIVIVNDGSKDKTVEKLIEHYDLKRVNRPYQRLVKSKAALAIYEIEDKVKITLVDKENGGKSDALNMGINMSRYPMFLCMDADSIIKKDALKKIVEPFLESDETVAVGGNIKVSNGMIIKDGQVVESKSSNKLIVKMQKIEYLRVFLNSRISLNKINGNLIISGAFGLYKKQAVVNVGGYSEGLMGEDMEIIVKIHSFYRKNNIKYLTSYVPDAICWTQVPEKYKVLKRQRRRWHNGLGESLSMHKYMFLNLDYGVIGMVSFPYFVFFEYLTPFLEILGIVTITVSYVLNFINIEFFLFYLLVYIGFNIIITLISLITNKFIFSSKDGDDGVSKLFIYAIIEAFGYRQLISLFRIGNPFKRNKKKEWGDMERVEIKSE